MTTINAFVENTYTDFDIDEVKVFNDTIKITAHLLEDVDVFSKSCLKDYKFSTISFDIVLCNNEEIHRINKEYRDKDSATDVITFALFADSENQFILDNQIQLGQIIISLEKVAQQAEENNISQKTELLNLLAHGILHLLGMDHTNDTDLDAMLSLQDKMIASVQNVKI